MEQTKWIKEDGTWTKEMWVMSILSDAQEEISMGLLIEASETINRAKRVLQGKYKELECGMIEVDMPTRRF